jgi:hypothetical protein
MMNEYPNILVGPELDCVVERFKEERPGIIRGLEGICADVGGFPNLMDEIWDLGACLY